MSPPCQDFGGGDPDGPQGDRHDAGDPGPQGSDPTPPAGRVPPPGERVWRHPSELHSGQGGSAPRTGPPASIGAGVGSARRATPHGYDWQMARHRRRLVLMGLVGTAAIAAAVAASGLLWESAAGRLEGTSTPTPLLSHVLTTDDLTPAIPPAAAAAARSLVALQVRTAGHVTMVCGMAVGDTGLVAAPAGPLSHAQSRILFATASGSAPVTELAVDRASGVALVRVPFALHAAPVADDGGMAAGHRATLLSVTTGGDGASARLDWSTAVVTSVDRPAPAGSARDIADIVAAAPPRAGTCGALLLDSRGSVIGLLDRDGTTGGDTQVFLPAPLVVGVSDQLALSGTVDHGWLDVSGTDAPAGTDGGRGGVVVGEVDPKGAAAGLVRVGDVIVTVSGEPVRSMAELRMRLYVLPPGAAVALELLRGGHRTVVDVQLGGSP